tara:strand:+ start:1044 stop:1655 length:612 start_codon:yes stop_codon:yes gene_type:complete
MKKILLLTFLLGAFTTNAQEVTFGAKAGLNISSFAGDETEDYDSRTSFHLGATAEIAISDIFSVQPELLFSSQGIKTEFSEPGYSSEGSIVTNYIHIPVMAKYYVTEGLSLEAGPQIGFLMSANSEGSSTVNGETESYDNDIKEDLSSLDFGLNIGAGYKLDSGLNFALRYNLGLSNIEDIDDDEDDFSNTNRVLQLSVGFTF